MHAALGLRRPERPAYLVTWTSEPTPPAGVEAAAVEAAEYPDLASLTESLDPGAVPPRQVLLSALLNVSGDTPSEAYEATVAVLEQVRQWLADERFAASRLVLLTRNATPAPATAGAAAGTVSLAAAAAAGLVRSAQTEHPGRFILLDIDDDPASRAAVPAALAAGEPQLAVHHGTIYVPRLNPAPASILRSDGQSVTAHAVTAHAVTANAVTAHAVTTPASRPRPLDPGGTVLVTGGTGTLGGLVARHLVVVHGVRHVLLASRSGEEAAGAGALRGELEGLGAEVVFAACDVGSAAEVEALVASVPVDRPLTAVVHAAGVLADGTVGSLSAGEVAAVFGPKAAGAWNLHVATRGLDLALFVLFSSVTGTLGGAGQGNYAAANAYLDALARRRHGLGLPATSLAWGLWERASGMTGAMGAADVARMRRSGIAPLGTQEGLGLLDGALGSPFPAVVPVRWDAAALRELAASGTLPPILTSLAPAAPRPAATANGAAGQPALARRLAGLATADQQALILELIRERVAAVLGFTTSDSINLDATFREIGFDSLSAVEMRNRLDTGDRAGLVHHARLRLSHAAGPRRPRVERGRGHGPASGHRRGAGQRVRQPTSRSRSSGWAAASPAACASPEDAVAAASGRAPTRSRRVPRRPGLGPRRALRPRPDTPGTAYAREGGFLYDAGRLRRRRSSGSARARRWRWTRSSGCCWRRRGRRWSAPGSTRRRCAAAGPACSSALMYQRLRPALHGAAEDVEGYLLTRQSPAAWSPAGSPTRSGFEGPAVTVDTACSSSLVALHLAAQALRSGECTLALAGGVTVMAHARHVRGVQPSARAGARRAVQGVRGAARTGPAGARASGCCCWSGCRTRGATGTRCWRWCVAAR